ncbi:uncharacterized protein CTHT_0032800 [Thermochaetoides thermophila DSM 1495]|uniref:Uncharacterized protein n=1 Tax=Chaetomium thermophilum (strain DSM 1495 / CBS 144.50 / IMI 039719) TaxID=759272 RepID=G0S5F7_CHATD|nr:hypothetical protein CTHT_0032800 [Thermochaetoides thermophila DSM 1495]EGS21422.1 hypothetical protein CTHT_0032800 [Thermochaetoides thermophila DSM 1495]
MSLFDKIKRSLEAAKKHQAQQAEKQNKESTAPPYKHVPTHAASDALLGGPPTWREMDRPKIVEANKRRSVLTANGIGMSGIYTPVHAGMPRVSSNLSHVSYPSAYANPVVHLPRNYSYSSIPPAWSYQNREMHYGLAEGGTLKGKEIGRIRFDHGYPSARASRSSSKVSTKRIYRESGPSPDSPSENANDSSSSQDDLEMKPVRHPASHSSLKTASSSRRPASDIGSPHRLHPSHARRVSDLDYGRSAYVVPRTPSFGSGIPPVPSIPPSIVGAAASSSRASSAGSSSGSSGNESNASSTTAPSSTSPSEDVTPATSATISKDQVAPSSSSKDPRPESSSAQTTTGTPAPATETQAPAPTTTALTAHESSAPKPTSSITARSSSSPPERAKKVKPSVPVAVEEEENEIVPPPSLEQAKAQQRQAAAAMAAAVSTAAIAPAPSVVEEAPKKAEKVTAAAAKPKSVKSGKLTKTLATATATPSVQQTKPEKKSRWSLSLGRSKSAVAAN